MGVAERLLRPKLFTTVCLDDLGKVPEIPRTLTFHLDKYNKGNMFKISYTLTVGH